MCLISFSLSFFFLIKDNKPAGAEIVYSPSDSFSPESGGSVKPSSAIDAMSTHGTIKLKK